MEREGGEVVCSVVGGENVSDCLANELRRKADESETLRRDFKSTALLLPAAIVVVVVVPVVVNEEQNGCELEGRTSGKRALREYLRVVRFAEFLIVEASSDVNNGV